MKATPEITEAARLAWNEISHSLDAKPTLFTDKEEFDEFYEKLLASLFEEEEEQ